MAAIRLRGDTSPAGNMTGMKTVLSGILLSLSSSLLAAIGPSTSVPPYLVALAPGVEFTSILTAGEAVKALDAAHVYHMAGIPDGLGAFDNGDGSFTLLMNHELKSRKGAVRAHGSRGAFVSQWVIRKRDLKVLGGQDLVRTVRLWDASSRVYRQASDASFSRLCSADLAGQKAFYHSRTRKGFHDGRIFMNGEEDGGDSRAFAHVVGGREHGTSYELPLLGNHPFENLLASPFEQDKTVVAATEDGGDNKVYFYIGEKQTTGSPVELAGLAGGETFELKIDAYIGDDPDHGFRSGTFRLVKEGGTSLARPEDGAWDTLDPSRFYFVTSASFNGNSRLWELRFHDIARPKLGGTIRVLIDGARKGVRMMDNITVDAAGNIYLQEDVGNKPHLGQIWKYSAESGTLDRLARHDPMVFLSGAPAYLTEDEESSGIIEVSDLFHAVEGYDTGSNRYFLLVVQAHYPLEGEAVEGGQLLLMKVPR